MASRRESTIGYERANNPRLQLDRDAFVAAKLAEEHVQPPYFREMHRRNREGAERLDPLPAPRAVSPDELAGAMARGLLLVDVRSAEAHAGCSVPGSLALPLGLLAGYGGWFLPYDRPLGLVVEDERELGPVVRLLARMGYRDLACVLAGGVRSWVTSGRPLQSIPAVSAQTVRARLGRGDGSTTLLDVRKSSEYAEGHLPGAEHRFLGELREDASRVSELGRPVTTYCSSGQRALVAASLLRRAGLDEVEVCFGSMEACRAIGCPVEGGR